MFSPSAPPCPTAISFLLLPVKFVVILKLHSCKRDDFVPLLAGGLRSLQKLTVKGVLRLLGGDPGKTGVRLVGSSCGYF